MSTGALIFMALSWALVLGLTTWAFARILKVQGHHDPDGIGPASPPVPPAADAPPADPRREG